MKAINIYALTRIDKAADIARFDRQMSKRAYTLKIKEWEVKGLKAAQLLLFLHDTQTWQGI